VADRPSDASGARPEIYIPTGQLVGRRAFRKNLAGVLDALLPFLWNIEKRA
jgi:hypothetical protein